MNGAVAQRGIAASEGQKQFYHEGDEGRIFDFPKTS